MKTAAAHLNGCISLPPPEREPSRLAAATRHPELVNGFRSLKIHTLRPGTGRAPAFTLVEMMITVGLLGFIVLGLTAMFIQTQRAFRAGTQQTDVLEAGRAVMDHLARQIEQMSPASISNLVNCDIRHSSYSTNRLNASDSPRTNVLSSFYMISEYNQRWKAYGFLVAVPGLDVSKIGAGTLYQFEYPTNHTGLAAEALLAAQPFNRFFTAHTRAGTVNFPGNDLVPYLNRITDGVVGFEVKPYDDHGFLITQPIDFGTSASGPDTVRVTDSSILPGRRDYRFYTNAVPAYLEVELSVLENSAYEKFKSLPEVSGVRLEYLAREQTAGRIHVFRRTIPIRTVDKEVYR